MKCNVMGHTWVTEDGVNANSNDADQPAGYIKSNLNSSNTDGSFTMVNSNLFFSPYTRKQIFRGVFLFYYEIVCCVLLELPHQGNSNEYTQYTIIV